MSLDDLAIVVWLVIQIVLLYVQVWLLRQTVSARRIIDDDSDDINLVAREKLRGHVARLSVIVSYLGLGVISFWPRLPLYSLLLVVLLLYGELVLLRNAVGDWRLVRTLARHAAAARSDSDAGPGTPAPSA